jgi:hypothetical protein
MSVAPLWLAPVGENMFPPRAPFLKVCLGPRGVQVATCAEEIAREHLPAFPGEENLAVFSASLSPAHGPKVSP